MHGARLQTVAGGGSTKVDPNKRLSGGVARMTMQARNYVKVGKTGNFPLFLL